MKSKRWLSLLLVLTLLAGMVILPAGASAAKLNKKKLTMVTGATFELKLSGTTGSVKWTSSNKKIASVSKAGLVKASKPGTCTITAKSGKKTFTCKVTVKQGVTKIKLNKTNLKLKEGKEFALKATVTPDNAANKKITWSSDNKNVATVNSKGVIKAVGSGSAEITATAADGSGKKAVCKVTVTGGYTLGAFSKFMINASFSSASDYLAGKENDSNFWNLVNESWIYEDSVTVIESKGIFVFARSDAVDFGEGRKPIRNYIFYDKNGKFRFALDIDYVGNHDLAVSVAKQQNSELEESGKDTWGYYGKTKYFACGNCLVIMEGITSLSSDSYPTFKGTVTQYRDEYHWTVHEY